MTLPSKKIVPTLIACFIAVGGVVGATLYNPAAAPIVAENNPLPLTTVSPVSAELGAGLAYGSTTDTGTTSGIPVASSLSAASSTGPLTATQKFAQDLFAQYMQEKGSSNAPLTDDEQNLIIQNTLLNDTPSLDASLYTQSNIKVTSDSSVGAIEQYGNAIGSIIIDANLASSSNELSIVAQATNDSNPAELKPLETLITTYKKVLAEMLAVPVPASAVSSDLNVINSLSAVIATDEELDQVFSDPVTGLIGAKQDEQTAPALITAFESLSSYLQTSGAVFSQTDPGHILIVPTQ